MIVTIDGPAGAGKSTVASRLAAALGFAVLDTGALYRAVTLAVMEAGIDATDADAVMALARRTTVRLAGGRVTLDERDVTDAIRRPDVSRMIYHIADVPSVREHLTAQQRRIAATGDFVTEGRDQGTVAFPEADVKVFLTASTGARATRRLLELRARGQESTWETVHREIEDRDRRDFSRAVGPLRRADDAHVVNTDNLTVDEVVATLAEIVRSRQTEPVSSPDVGESPSPDDRVQASSRPSDL